MRPQKSDIVTLIQDRLGQTADHVLIYNNYDLTEGSVLLFTFKHGASFPFSVLKLSRNRSILLREYKNLQLICDACPGLATTPLFF